MNTISNTLQEYLLLQKTLYLPSIGTLKLKYHSAQFDPLSKTLHPCRYELMLDETQESDPQIVPFLSYKLSQDAYLSNQVLASFTEKILNTLKNSIFVWQHIGVFKMDKSNKVLFEQQHNFSTSFAKPYVTPILPPIEKPVAIEPQKSFPLANVTAHTEMRQSNFNKYRLNQSNNPATAAKMFIENNHTRMIRTEFLDTELAERYNTFQKISIIVVLIVTILYLFFHLFLNDFSFHSYSN